MSASRLTDRMIAVPGGTFAMGSEAFYPEEAPVRRVRVDTFRIDAVPVTNTEFADFVAATGHVTLAEMAPDPKDYPGMLPELGQPGSLVFDPPPGPVSLTGGPVWWHFRLGASWRAPTGPGSSIAGLEDHPVVHIAHTDAEAYATWAGKALPSEAEWEWAARGGLEAEYAWGDELAPKGRMMANYWQGPFPHGNSLEDGWLRTSPVRSYPPNGYGLYDMIGNVWEWTADWFAQPKIEKKRGGHCCVPANPRGGTRGGSIVKGDPIRIPRKVMKGGSHLCAESYCQRYRPAARYAQPVDTSTSHVGFRCVVREN